MDHQFESRPRLRSLPRLPDDEEADDRRRLSTIYNDIAHGCGTLDLKSWSHPTRQVLERTKIRIIKVELCNQGIYPIYTVMFVASPMLGVNDKYFNKLYIEMAAANGFHSFAFVDPGWDVIVTVDVASKNEISISYYEFDAPGAK